MKAPSGMLDRLKEGRPTARDLDYVEYQIGIATDRTEVKLLRHLKARIVAGTLEGRRG